MDKLLGIFAAIFQVYPDKLVGPGGQRPLITLKHIFRYVAIKVYKSESRLARELLIDRTCINNSIKKVKGFMKNKDPEFMGYWDKFLNEAPEAVKKIVNESTTEIFGEGANSF